jgi:hypothetical protein
LPADAQLEGRLIVVTQKGFRDSWYLITALSQNTEAEKIVAWYRRCWNLELDLRTLKGTLRLKHLPGKSTAAVEKELLIAVAAYGFVRALMGEAAQRAGPHPRELTFTRAHGPLNAMTAKLCVLRSPSSANRPMTASRPTSPKPNYPGEAKFEPIREQCGGPENTIRVDTRLAQNRKVSDIGLKPPERERS